MPWLVNSYHSCYSTLNWLSDWETFQKVNSYHSCCSTDHIISSRLRVSFSPSGLLLHDWLKRISMANTQGDGLFCWQLIPVQNMQQFISNSLPTYIIVGTQPHCWWSILRLLQLLSWLLLNWVSRDPFKRKEGRGNSYHSCYSTSSSSPSRSRK